MRYVLGYVLFVAAPLLADWPANVAATGWVRSGNRGVGTGWVVDTERRWLVTARHVVADREQVEVFFPDPDGDTWHPLRRHYVEQQRELAERGRLVTGQVIAKRDHADLALVQLASLPPKTPALSLAKDVRLAEAVQLIGHRHDAETLWTASYGVVRQSGQLKEGYFWAAQKLGVGAKVIFVQMPVEAGDSGAAIVNVRGEVLGLLSAFSNRTAGVGIAIHRDEIQALLADARGGKPPPPSPTNAEERTRTFLAATVWLRPEATESRGAGVLVDRDQRLILTSNSSAGRDDVLTVVFPQWHEQQLKPEAEHYRDLLGQRLAGTCVQGFVLARDPLRDLALIQCERLPRSAHALPIAERDATVGSNVHTMSHPLGVEFLWLYAAGKIRSTGRLALQTDRKETDPRPIAHVLQVPHHGHSSGGLVANDQGEVLGILASRESPRHELGYSVTTSELRTFLKEAKPRWQPTTLAEYSARAIYLAERGGWAEAIATWRLACQHEPMNRTLQLNLAGALLAHQQTADARTLAETIAKEPKLAPDVQARLGLLFAQLKEAKHAEPLLTTALKANPRSIPALLGRGALRSGKEALADLDEVLFLDPNNAEAFALRVMKHDPRDPDAENKRLADLSRVLELTPYALEPRRQRAEWYLEHREWKKASADATRITELASMDPAAWLGLAVAHLRAGNEAHSLPALVAVVRLAPTQFNALGQRIRQYGQTIDDHERVSDWYEQFLRGVQPWAEKQQAWINPLLAQRKTATARAWRAAVEKELAKPQP